MAAVAGDIEQRAAARDTRRSLWSWTRVWFVLVTLVLVVGWFLPLDRYLSPRQGAGYWLGIVGGSLMLLLLLYPLRKRVASFAFLGNSRIWFQIHMALGIVGPLCILYHCLYRLGAANSNVALICMLVVSGSGVMGRYLYARIHHGLYGRQASLAEFRAEAERLRAETSGVARLLPELAGRLDGVAIRVPTPNVSVIDFKFVAKRATSKEEINAAVKRAAEQQLKGILGYTDAPNVSTDFNHDPRSSIFHMDQTRVMDGTLVRVMSWYDNEWGFSNRMLDTAVAAGRLG